MTQEETKKLIEETINQFDDRVFIICLPPKKDFGELNEVRIKDFDGKIAFTDITSGVERVKDVLIKKLEEQYENKRRN